MAHIDEPKNTRKRTVEKNKTMQYLNHKSYIILMVLGSIPNKLTADFTMTRISIDTESQFLDLCNS